jgi:enterochelin esterase-like enzyme
MNICSFFALLGVSAYSMPANAEWKLGDMVSENGGKPEYHARPLEKKFLNPVSEEDERAFQERARLIISKQSELSVPAGNTYFENEKRTYGFLMAQALGKRGMDAVAELQFEDAQKDEWHKETKGIDLYAAFTLKHQMRKYFYFGDVMEPDYRKRMFEGGKKWSEKDPMLRPHPTFKGQKEGWGPDAKNSWVDVRNTENLFLMRVSSVYLMAEETGSKETAVKYKAHILNYAKTLHSIGMGEWDSENYHGHSLAPLANLYDFAKDAEVKLAAKACLDWMCTAGAVKYFRGGFNGPSKRDYNHAQPFGGSAANMLWVLFGDSPQANEHWESDEVHMITSAYRPPPAVVELARKNFGKPVEIFASKPSYTATTEFQLGSKPEYLETQFIANSFQMGSLSGGTTPGVSDVSGFKILVADEKRGAVALQAVPGPDPDFPGSPLYQEGKVSGENRVAQFANLAIWLVKDGASPWLWVVPESVKLSEEGGVTFLECDRTWVAIRSLGAGALMRDGAMSDKVSKGEKPHFPDHQVLAAKGDGKQKFCGLAVEVGEKESHGSFAEFKKAVLAAEVDVTKLDEGIIQYKSTDGKALGFHWNDNPQDLGVWRNGKRHDWMEHAKYLYWVNSADGVETTAPVFSRWGEGKLYVEAGGKAFLSTVDDGGKASFQNGTPEALRKLVAKVEDGREEIKVAGLPAQIKVYRSARPGGTNDIYTVDSDYQRGPVNVEVLTPDGYDPKGIYPVLYCLPVNTGRDGNWGHSLDEIARRDLHNRHQIICVAPEYDIDPWLGDMPEKPDSGNWIRQRAFITEVVVPMVDGLYATKPEQDGRFLLGFSKVGIGALGLILQNPEMFQSVAIYDNADMEPVEKIFHEWGMDRSYGSYVQFQATNPLSLIARESDAMEKFEAEPRIFVLAGSEGHIGVKRLLQGLEQHRIVHRHVVFPGTGHSWVDDWLPRAIDLLVAGS